jgi:aspartate/methionine/tyrosine aminotransferase
LLAQPSALRYDPRPAGRQIAREAVASYYRERKLAVDARDVFLTASTSEAYSCLFKLLADPGDRVVVPRPGYPLFDHLAQFESLGIDSYPLRYDGSWHVDLAPLRRSVTPRTRALVSVNPNNPTGSFLTEEEWEAMAAMAREHSLGLILDEVFSDFNLKGGDPAGLQGDRRTAGVMGVVVTSAAGRQECLNFVLSGFSKVLCLPQMKLGWIVVQGPEPERAQARARLELIADTFLSVNTPVQLAAGDWLRHRRAIRLQVLERLAGNLRSLNAHLEGSACCVLDVQGGWYAVVQVPRTRSEEEWVLTLLEHDHVRVHPGYFFDFESEAYLVLSLLCEPSIFEEGVRRLVRRVEQSGQ